METENHRGNGPQILYIRPIADMQAGSSPSPALTILRALHSDGTVFLTERDSDDLEPALLFRDIDRYDSVIARPIRGGNSLASVPEEAISALGHHFVIGSISSDPCHKLIPLCRPKGIEVQHSKLSLNAESVADLALWYALTMHRPFAAAAQGMAFSNEFSHARNKNLENHQKLHLKLKDIERTTTLAQKEWSILGMGSQAAFLSLRLAGIGIDDINIYYKPKNDLNDSEWHERLVTFIAQTFGPDTSKKINIEPCKTNSIRAAVSFSFGWGRSLRIQLTDDLNYALSTCDVASIHLPYCPPDGDRPTHHLIGRNEIDRMRENSLLINVARQEIWNEKEVIEAASNRKIRLASDLLHPECEGGSFISTSRSYFIEELTQEHLGTLHPSPNCFSLKQNHIAITASDSRPSRLFTPHIGGATTDIYSIECEVVGKVLFTLSHFFHELQDELDKIFAGLLAQIPQKFRLNKLDQTNLEPSEVFAVCGRT